jgi:hypothetical protein
MFANVTDNMILIFKIWMKVECSKKEHMVCSTKNEINGLACSKNGTCTMREMRTGSGKEDYLT